MILSNEKKLSLFLKNYLRSGGPDQNSLSQADFVKAANQYESGRKLDTVTFNKVVNGKTKPGEEVLRKIAQVVLTKPNAQISDLWAHIETADFPISDEDELRLASGFTVYSALLLSAMGIVNEMGKCQLPAGMKFTFLSDAEGKPIWVENLDDLTAFRPQAGELARVYIADELERLYANREIDGFFMLRSSFEGSRFSQLPEADYPVQVTRCATGYATSMYVVGRNFPPMPAPRSTELFALVDQITHLNILFKNRPVRLYYLTNPTVKRDLNKYFSYPELQQSIHDYRQAPLSLTQANYTKFLTQAVADFENPNLVQIVAGFEPLLNHLYHDLLRQIKTKYQVEDVGYQFFNLSRLANESSTYCFYARPEALQNSEKLVKINELLSLVGSQIRLDNLNSVPLTNLLFRADDVDSDVGKFERLSRVYQEIELRTNSIPIVQLLSRQIL